MRTFNVETRTHGRVVVRDAADPIAVVVGFHGYMEDAEIQMDRLIRIHGSERWTLASVQALHRFYRGKSQVVSASWMTRQDRELMIADNIEYVSRVVETLVPSTAPLITVGFSQGVAMALRGAVRASKKASGAIAVGGDVPPELLADSSVRFPPVLLARGDKDDWYTAEKLDADVFALRSRGVPVETLIYPGGHEWTTEIADAASAFISRCA
jgi:predicted esterase